MPRYVQEENYSVIQSRLRRLTFRKEAIENLVSEGEKFDGFNLSNIFDYTLKDEFHWFADVLAQGGRKNARYVYWNVMHRRKLSEEFPDLFVEELDSFHLPGFPDKGLNYSRMCVNCLG